MSVELDPHDPWAFLRRPSSLTVVGILFGLVAVLGAIPLWITGERTGTPLDLVKVVGGCLGAIGAFLLAYVMRRERRPTRGGAPSPRWIRWAVPAGVIFGIGVVALPSYQAFRSAGWGLEASILLAILTAVITGFTIWIVWRAVQKGR